MAFERYIEARVVGQLHGSQTVNVFHFGTDADAADIPAEVALLVALATAIMACVIEFLLPAVSSDWKVDEVQCKQLFPTVTDPLVHAAPPDSNGERGPVNTSFETMLMRLRTGGGGRRGRGRKFLPPPGDADLTASVLSSTDVGNAYAAFMLCLLEKFINTAKTTPYTMVVVSATHLKTNANDYNGASRPVTSLALESNVSVLRSRKLGTGI